MKRLAALFSSFHNGLLALVLVAVLGGAVAWQLSPPVCNAASLERYQIRLAKVADEAAAGLYDSRSTAVTVEIGGMPFSQAVTLPPLYRNLSHSGEFYTHRDEAGYRAAFVCRRDSAGNPDQIFLYSLPPIQTEPLGEKILLQWSIPDLTGAA
ncbi:hypothetical protein LJC63_00815 [Ruminococcaceae bacterium OttesenSCG-928-L11]|nr:hypothetical protein [Ruminococcaceae bacterium OttesenSCG-928-L11]